MTLITSLHRVCDGQELASAVFSTAYCAGILTNDQWQGLLTAIDECAPPGTDCALEMLGMVPVIGGVAEIPSFLNAMCLTRQNLDHGRPFEAGLHLIDGVAGGFLALAGLYNVKHANDAFEAYQSTVNCATELLEIDWHTTRSDDDRTDVEILTDSLKLLPDSVADFRYQCLMQGASDLTIVVADTAESNLDQIEITDGFVWEYSQRHIVWGYLGPHANPAGSTLANPYYACEFRHTADSAETINVSLLHRQLDSSLIQLNWDSVQIDSAGGFRIPASDTTDCIKMFLDQDGDGVYEQIVYPEVGGASMQLVAMVEGDSIRLSWNPVYCASSYRVYWGPSLDEITTQLTETADTTCADATLHSVRFYHVTAVFP
ncbi:MAG: hypothetical protein NT025_04845 [bacterium]|nr:hypothetical protein [bacterium]